MGLLDDAFASLTDEVIAQLGSASITIRRIVRGTLDTTTLARAKGMTDVVVTADRSASRPSFETMGEGGGAQAVVEEWDYLVRASDVVDHSAAVFVPVRGDLVIDASNGASVTYAISRVGREVNETMLKITVRGVPIKQTA